jgi:hypothetical protein
MKKFLMTVGVLLLILAVLISCAPEPPVLFQNFMDDMDVEGRFSDNAAEIDRGKGSDLIVAAIDALIGDLNTMTLDNKQAKDITAEFISSCEVLIDAAKTNSKDKVKEAKELFQSALKKEYAFTKNKSSE